MWVVILGDLMNGHRFVGPFETMEEAKEWVEDLPFSVSDTFKILDLLEPDELLEHIKRNIQ